MSKTLIRILATSILVAALGVEIYLLDFAKISRATQLLVASLCIAYGSIGLVYVIKQLWLIYGKKAGVSGVVLYSAFPEDSPSPLVVSLEEGTKSSNYDNKKNKPHYYPKGVVIFLLFRHIWHYRTPSKSRQPKGHDTQRSMLALFFLHVTCNS